MGMKNVKPDQADFNRFLPNQADFEEKLFWIVISVCMAVGLYSSAVTFAQHLNPLACIVTASCCVLFFVIMVVCSHTRRFKDCYTAMCLVLNCILLPVDYFFCGGAFSGMPMYFVMGVFLCAFCLDKVHIIVAVSFSVVALVTSMVIAMNFPEWVQEVSEDYVYSDVLTTFVIVSAGIVAISVFIQREYRRQHYKEINNDIIDILGTMVEFRNLESGDHIRRIKGFTALLLSRVNKVYKDVKLSKSDIKIIVSASALHDVGKIAVPDSILLKCGPLTEPEREIMKLHTTKGCEIIQSIEGLQDHKYYRYGYEICRYHHERWDGNGYPDHLKGDAIPLAAQVVSLADVYDALVNERCYKPAFSFEQSYNMIMNGECGAFSPRLLKCLELAKDDMEIFNNAMKQETITENG